MTASSWAPASCQVPKPTAAVIVFSRGPLKSEIGRDRTDFSACVELLFGVEACHCACFARELV